MVLGRSEILASQAGAIRADFRARSAAAGDDQGFAEGGAAGALGFERGEHDDELAAHEVEHVGGGIDAEDVAAERELAERAERDPELALPVGGDGSTSPIGSTWTSKVWLGGKPRPMTVVKLAGRDRRRRCDSSCGAKWPVPNIAMSPDTPPAVRINDASRRPPASGIIMICIVHD